MCVVKCVLFVCTQNAGRSQMAEAFFTQRAPADIRGESAGTSPASHVHPEVVEVMREAGIDLSGRRPRKLTVEMQSHADWAVTMGCGEACPVVPGLAREDWPLDDPKGRPVDDVRRIRDAIRAHVETLVVREGWGRPNQIV